MSKSGGGKAMNVASTAYSGGPPGSLLGGSGGGSMIGASAAPRDSGGRGQGRSARPRNSQAQAGKREHRNHRRPERQTVRMYGSYEDDVDAATDDLFYEAQARRSSNKSGGKVNLNHLLNFQMSPYTEAAETAASPMYEARAAALAHSRSRTFGVGSGRHPLDKMRFINANYRFMVDPAGDYSMQVNNPDLLVPWELISQVVAPVSTESSQCPICLSETPTAPRISRCGHVFCLPCLLRFLDSATEQKKTSTVAGVRETAHSAHRDWRECPICGDHIRLRDVRPYRALLADGAQNVFPGSVIDMRLIIREPGTTLALPQHLATEASKTQIPWSNDNTLVDHARIIKASTSYMREQSERESSELMQVKQYDEVMFDDDGRWYDLALSEIDSDKHRYSLYGEPPAAVETASVVAADGSSHDDTRVSHLQETDDQMFRFYQPEAGTHHYLSTLDIRVLRESFGSLTRFPPKLAVIVQSVSAGHAIDDELRKRVKYLGHLPVGCEVSFIECDWLHHNAIRDEIKTKYGPELKRRAKRRSDKERYEETQRMIALQEEERKLRETMQEQSRTGFSVTTGGGAYHEQYGVSSSDGSDASVSWRASPGTGVEALPGLSQPVTSDRDEEPSVGERTVWGTRAVGDGPRETFDDWDRLLQEDLAAQLAGQSLESGSNRRRGKKKSKKVVLMSTGGRGGPR